MDASLDASPTFFNTWPSCSFIGHPHWPALHAAVADWYFAPTKPSSRRLLKPHVTPPFPPLLFRGNLHCTEPHHFWTCSAIGIMQLRHSQHALGLMFALMSTTGIRAAAVATRMSLDDTRSCDSVQVSWRVSAKRMIGRAQEHGLHMPILSAPLPPRPAEIATCGLGLTHFTCAGLPPQLHQAHWRHPPAPLKVLFLSLCLPPVWPPIFLSLQTTCRSNAWVLTASRLILLSPYCTQTCHW